MPEKPVLSPDLIRQAVEHMNEDHKENLLDYARNLAGLSWAEEVEMLSLDVEGFDLDVKGGDQMEQARIIFDPPLTKANQLRPRMVDLANQAKQKRSVSNES